MKNSNCSFQSINTESINSSWILENNIEEITNPTNTHITTNNTINEINLSQCKEHELKEKEILRAWTVEDKEHIQWN